MPLLHRDLNPRVLAVAVSTVLALGVGGTAVAVTAEENARQSAAAVEAVRVAQVQEASRQRLEERQAAAGVAAVEATRARVAAERGAAVAAALTTLESARAGLAASPQAAPELRAALQTAVDTAAALVAVTPAPTVAASQAAVAPVPAAHQAVLDSQVAWQVAEDARLAAEAAAREAAAAAEREAAERAAARSAQPASRSSSGKAPAPTRAGSPAPGASVPAAVAESAPSGVPEFSAGALGDAINAYRAQHGLPAMSISRSGGLVAHAAAMAQAGSLWHGGSDKIVGYTMPGTASRLVSAWAASPGHNAWMLRADKSSMQVGAVLLDNRLYGAVNFS